MSKYLHLFFVVKGFKRLSIYTLEVSAIPHSYYHIKFYFYDPALTDYFVFCNKHDRLVRYTAIMDAL